MSKPSKPRKKKETEVSQAESTESIGKLKKGTAVCQISCSDKDDPEEREWFGDYCRDITEGVRCGRCRKRVHFGPKQDKLQFVAAHCHNDALGNILLSMCRSCNSKGPPCGSDKTDCFEVGIMVHYMQLWRLTV